MALSALKPTRTGSFSESVLIAVTGYNITDPQKKVPNKNGPDTMTGVLMRDALGIVAEFDPNTNAPITQVTLTLTPPTEAQGVFKRPEILDKYKGKGQSPAIKPQGIVTLDGARLTSPKGKQPYEIAGNWMNSWSDEYNETLQFISVAKLVEIKREGRRQEPVAPGTNPTYQSAYLIEDRKSEKVTNKAEFRAKAIECLTWIGADTELPEMPGNAGFRIRAVEMGEPGERGEPGGVTALVKDCFGTWDRERNTVRTPEQAVDAFMAEESAWMSEIESSGTTTHFEVMPVSRVATGSQSLPMARAQSKLNTTDMLPRDQVNKFDDAYTFCAYPFTNEEGQQRIATGVVRADMFSIRMEVEPDEHGRTKTPWIRTRTSTLPERKIYGSAEFPTDVLPEQFKAIFEENAKANYKAMSDLKKDAKKAAEAEAEPESEAPRPQ